LVDREKCFCTKPNLNPKLEKQNAKNKVKATFERQRFSHNAFRQKCAITRPPNPPLLGLSNMSSRVVRRLVANGGDQGDRGRGERGERRQRERQHEQWYEHGGGERASSTGTSSSRSRSSDGLSGGGGGKPPTLYAETLP